MSFYRDDNLKITNFKNITSIDEFKSGIKLVKNIIDSRLYQQYIFREYPSSLKKY